MKVVPRPDGRVLYSEGVTHEQAGRYAQAQACYQQSDTLGYGRSAFRLGQFCLTGKLQAPDKLQAFAYFNKAAGSENRDQARACFNLGLMLETADGVVEDCIQACFWYREAERLGNTEAASRGAALSQRLQAPPAVPEPRVEPQVAPGLKEVALAELVLHEVLGRSPSSVVTRATWRHSEVAVKQFDGLRGVTLEAFQSEAQGLAALGAQRLVRLLGIGSSPGFYAWVMEYLPQSLADILAGQALLSWPVVLQMAVDMAQGLCCLHAEGRTHRTLKPEHILVDAHHRAKISFSRSALFKQGSSLSRPRVEGETAWMAPELFGLKPRYSEASDVYALGMILWTLFSRQRPYANQSSDEIRTRVKAGGRALISEDCPPAYQALMERCWAQEPSHRPTSVEVLSELQAQLEYAEAMTLKSWHCDPALKPESQHPAPYHLIDVPFHGAQSDVQKVVEGYQRSPVPCQDLKSIRVVYNLSFNRSFEARLMALEGRHQNVAFTPQWSRENNPTQRQAVAARLEAMARPYQDRDYPNVKIVALWHGTKPAILDSIFRTGFANLASTDPGFYGKGIYSAYEASYAHRVYSQGALLFSYVACHSAYPVIEGDLPKLMGGANYQNYDAHFIPVKPKNPHNASEVNYIPCGARDRAQYHELVVFESAHCLPRYLIELQPSLPRTLGAADEPEAAKKAGAFKVP